jgi:hypothetical protein
MGIKEELARIKGVHQANRSTAEGDWSAKDKRKAAIVALANDPRYPIGVGMEISLRGDPVLAVAISEAVLENPNLLQLVAQTDGRILLVKRRQFDGRVRANFRSGLESAGQILTADMLLEMKRSGTLDALPGVHHNPETDYDPVADAAVAARRAQEAEERAHRARIDGRTQVAVPAEMEARARALAEQITAAPEKSASIPSIIVKE